MTKAIKRIFVVLGISIFLSSCATMEPTSDSEKKKRSKDHGYSDSYLRDYITN